MAMKRYRDIEAQLIHLRWLHRGHEADEEEDIVEALAEAWWDLSDTEQRRIRSEGSKSLIARDESCTTISTLVDVDPVTGSAGTVRRYQEVA